VICGQPLPGAAGEPSPPYPAAILLAGGALVQSRLRSTSERGLKRCGQKEHESCWIHCRGERAMRSTSALHDRSYARSGAK